MSLQVKLDMSEPIERDMPSEPKVRQQAMNSPEWEEWRKVEKVEMHGIVGTCV